MKTIALVIGISDYRDAAFHQIPGASADSSRFAASLVKWGLPADWIYHISQEKATKAEIIKAFYSLRAEFDVEAKFLLYFAGHGVREPVSFGSHLESSLVLYDTNAQDVFGTGLRLVELMQLIRALKPVQTFLFIDACSLRLNRLINPLNDSDIFSTSNSKGFFCMFSSGVKPSYEDVEKKSGYFTTALLKAIGELHQTKAPSCHDILKRVEKSLVEQNLPAPEAYHVGSSQIWPLENTYSVVKASISHQSPALVERRDALNSIQTALASKKCPVIWMWGEAGLGKTVIAEQFCKKEPQAIYISIKSLPSLPLVFQSIIEQIRARKSELFFNRPSDSLLTGALEHVKEMQPDSVIILDHLDRLDANDVQEVLSHFDSVELATLIVTRHSYGKKLFVKRAASLIQMQAASFSPEEVEELIEQSGLQNSLSGVLVNMTHGNALKTRQMLVKLSGQATPLEGKMSRESIKSIKAIIACGGFLDEALFCQIYDLKQTSLSTLAQFGLIRYTKEGCFPHDVLEELVDKNEWKLDLKKAASYWDLQVSHTPFNRLACRSLVLMVGTIKDCTAYKNTLGMCLGTLNEREYCSFLLDLVEIFTRYKWDDLLLQASDYLVDHEEYQRSGEVLQHLVYATNTATKHHATKNEIRRLVWIGQYIEAIKLYSEVNDACKTEALQVAMRNHVGIAEFFIGNIDKARALFQANFSLKGVDDERELGITKYMLGLIMTYRNENMEDAKKLIEASILIFESTKFYHWIIVGLNGLADLSYSLKEWQQALFSLQKAHTFAKALQNNTFLIFTLKNIARVQLRLFGPQSDEVTGTIREMEALLKEVLKTGPNWATMWAQNVLCTVYAHRKEPLKMLSHIHDVAKLTEHYDECHIFSLSNLGHLAALNNEGELARQYYGKAYDLCRKVHNPFAIVEIRQDFLDCDLPLHLQEELCTLQHQ